MIRSDENKKNVYLSVAKWIFELCVYYIFNVIGNLIKSAQSFGSISLRYKIY